MIKSESQNTQASGSDAMNHECWHKEPNVPAARFESTDGRVLVLPYQHLVAAAMILADKEEQITLTYASHEVLIQGHGLNRLLVAFQKQSVDWVRVLPRRYQELVEVSSVSIEKIDVHSLSQTGGLEG